MPTWVNGIPRDNGATDFEDSARLAGMLAAAGMSPLPQPDVYINKHGDLARWAGSSLPFTRDQLIPLAYFAKMRPLPSLVYGIEQCVGSFTAPNGKDFLAPHHKAHIRSCLNVTKKWSIWAKMWLKGEIYFHAMYERGLSEPNQLICMLLTAGPEFVRMWKRANPMWAESINYYWSNWRNEPELAATLIKVLAAY